MELERILAEVVRRGCAELMAPFVATFLRGRKPTAQAIALSRVVDWSSEPFLDLALPWMSPAFAERVLTYAKEHRLLVICSSEEREDLAFLEQRLPADQILLAIHRPGALERRIRVALHFQELAREKRAFVFDEEGELYRLFEGTLKRGVVTRNSLQAALLFLEQEDETFLERIFGYRAKPIPNNLYSPLSPEELHRAAERGVRVIPFFPNSLIWSARPYREQQLIELGLSFRDLRLPPANAVFTPSVDSETRELLVSHGLEEIYASRGEDVIYTAYPKLRACKSWSHFLLLAHRIQIGLLDFS